MNWLFYFLHMYYFHRTMSLVVGTINVTFQAYNGGISIKYSTVYERLLANSFWLSIQWKNDYIFDSILYCITMFTIRDSDFFIHYFRRFYYNIVLAESIGQEKVNFFTYSYIFHTGTVTIKALFGIESRKYCLWRYTICWNKWTYSDQQICKPSSKRDGSLLHGEE